MIAGALSVVKGIKICLDQYRSKTMYSILGLMLGSFYAIAMGPTTLEVPVAALSVQNFDFMSFVVGIGLVILLQFAGNKKETLEDVRLLKAESR